jgi:ATP-binding cassette subfamily F protein 3
MSILTASNLGLAHGAFDVFQGISLAIPDDARIGLVGPNGIGKTTLLRILAGVVAPTTGSVSRARGRTLGYLRQDAREVFAEQEHTIYDALLDVFAPLRARGEELRALEARMAVAVGETGADDGLLARYGAAQEAFERDGGYTYEARLRRTLEGLGFARAQWDLPVGHLSGGQKTRVLLARLLLEAPDLLILDEPTNHLDMEAVEWLEGTLRAWPGALLVVSHDRYFLDRTVDHIWDMGRASLDVYRGAYSAYVHQRQERWERQQTLFAEHKERLEKELDYIRRNIAGQRTDQAKGKLRRLSRELKAIEELGLFEAIGKSWSETGVGNVHPMGVDEAAARIRALQPPAARPVLSMSLKAARRSGDLVLRATNLEVGYPNKPLFTADDILLRRGECAALIGPNGAGKTTFLRTVLGDLAPLAGDVRLGASLKVGYFAQAHDGLNGENSVMDELMAHRPTMTIPEARDHLAQYLFRGEDVFKRVKRLSGGERGRLALAILAVDGANLLLLDEPTNHLDIPAQEVLQESLERFGGTLLIVSHDRYLVDRLAETIWEVRAGRLRVFDGTYQEFVVTREGELARAKEAERREGAAPSRNGAPNGHGGAGGAGGAGAGLREERKSLREERKRAEGVARLEAEIAAAEELLAECTRKLQEESESGRHEEVGRLGERYTATQQQLDRLMAEWLVLAGE